MSNLPHNKLIDLADFSHPELLPHLHDIARGEMVRFGLSEPMIVPDSKQWECAMMLRTLTDLGVLRPGAVLAGIGAGTEETTFVLASKGCIVFPTDRYLERTPWSDVAPADFMINARQYSTHSYERGSVIPVHTDARLLALPTNFFDGVYSAGSIEHFGSLEAVAAAAEEIGRILKPGGVAVLSTEFRLDGPNGKPWFNDDCILFTPALIEEHIVRPSGLEVINAPSFSTSPKTFDSRVILTEFLDEVKHIRTLADKKNVYPNLVLYHDGFLFCSVHLALQKPLNAPVSRRASHAARFEADVTTNAIRASESLVGRVLAPSVLAPCNVPSNHGESDRSDYYRCQLETLLKSRSMRLTKPLRNVAVFVRSKPLLRRFAQVGAHIVPDAPRGSERSDYYRAQLETVLLSRSMRLTKPLRDAAAFARSNPLLRRCTQIGIRVTKSGKRWWGRGA